MTAENTTNGAKRRRFGEDLSAMPLFAAACLFAAGIAISQWLPLRASFIFAALLPLAALCIVAAFRAQRILWLPLGALWILLGAWCAQMEPHPAPAAQLAALSDGLLRTVEGTVVADGPVRASKELNVGEPASDSYAERIDLQVSSVEVVDDSTDAQMPVDGGVRLTVRWPQANATTREPQPRAEPQLHIEPPLKPFRCGDRVRAVVRLLPPEVYHDPGAWSRADYLLDEGVTSTASAAIERVEKVGRAEGRYFACRTSELQHLASARLLALPAQMRRLPALLRLDADDAILLSSMIAGDRTYLNRSLRGGFERTGSFHMLVVSGFHLAIVAGCIFWLARRLRIPRVPGTLATIAVSWAYAFFTGFATPVQRSLWMVTLYLLGRLLYRERSPLNTIGFAALCLLCASPRSLLDSSFQMTLLAVVAIAGLALPLLENGIHPYLRATANLRLIALDAGVQPKIAQFRVQLRMMADALQHACARSNKSATARFAWAALPWTVRFVLRIGELIAVSCAIELAMTLPMAVYFHRVTLFALPVNLLILPLLVVIMPCALITLAAVLAWAPAATLPAAATAVPLHSGLWLVRVFGSLRFGDMRIPPPTMSQSLFFIALLGVAMVLARAGRWRLLGPCAALALAALVAVAPRPIEHPRGGLLVEAIDVGQGDSLLVITPDGKTLLVDGGGYGGGPRQAAQEFDIGEEVVSPALWARGIRRLDAVALSHAHSDHMGGLPAVLRNFRPAELWVGNNPSFHAYNALLDEAAALHARIRRLHAGDELTLGQTAVHVLAPLPGYHPGPEPANNDSLVLHVAYGATSVLLEGDAEAPIEQAMLSEQGLSSTLLKVGHHGSVSSTRPEFLARVAPQWAVISCGLHNRYGHPRGEVLEALQAAHVRTYRTDLNGATCFTLNGASVITDPFCAGDP